MTLRVKFKGKILRVKPGIRKMKKVKMCGKIGGELLYSRGKTAKVEVKLSLRMG